MKTQCPLLADDRLSEGGDKGFFFVELQQKSPQNQIGSPPPQKKAYITKLMFVIFLLLCAFTLS